MVIARAPRSANAPRFTAAEAKRFIAEARKNGVEVEQGRTLRARLEAHPDQFAPAARKALSAFFAEELAQLSRSAPVKLNDTQGHLADPAGVFGQSISYAPVDGQAFIGGARATDVAQGQLGDCFFLAALSSMAAQHPELVEKNLTDNHDGTYTVRLFQKGALGMFQHLDVKVDGDLAVRNQGLVYAHGTNVKELWPALYEKAWAEAFGRTGYAALNSGGVASEAIERLTGKPAARWELQAVLGEQGPDKIFESIRQGLANGDLATASTFQPRSPEAAGYPEVGLVAAHAYSLLGVGEAHGTRYVELRNPWAVVESGQDRKADGVFRMPFDEFCRRFQYLDCTV